MIAKTHFVVAGGQVKSIPGCDAALESETERSLVPLLGEEAIMWWAVGIGGIILYLIVAVTLGVMTLRNGHGWMFFIGIFFPSFWIFGAFMKPPETTTAAHA